MIDENEDYVTKPKLKITAKAFKKYNDRNRVAAKQTNKVVIFNIHFQIRFNILPLSIYCHFLSFTVIFCHYHV